MVDCNVYPTVRNCATSTDSNCVASYNIFANDPRGIGLDSAVKAVLDFNPDATPAFFARWFAEVTSGTRSGS